MRVRRGGPRGRGPGRGGAGRRSGLEGAETAAQSARLRQLECNRVQGYLYSRPLPPNQVPAMLNRLGLGVPVPVATD